MKTTLLTVGLCLAAGVAGHADTHYAAPPGVGANPTPDYTSWATAATSIHDAVAATAAGDTVLVSNGTYLLTNQVVITNIVIRSWKQNELDRDGTIVDGNWPNVTNRCFYLNHSNALAEGFTLTNGFTTGALYGAGAYIAAGTLRGCRVTGNTASNSVKDAGGGGGVYAINAESLITNCELTANQGKLYSEGGGAYLKNSARMANCRVMFNQASSGDGVLSGGGVRMTGSGTLLCNSVIASNNGAGYGGGVCMDCTSATLPGAILRNCLIGWNSSTVLNSAGLNISVSPTRRPCTVENCTIVSNRVMIPYAGGNKSVMGVFANTIVNALLYFVDTYTNGVFTNCCLLSTNSLVYSSGNITNNPRFADAVNGNFRLGPDSPCLNTGVTLDWMTAPGPGYTDLDGYSRVDRFSGRADMGCYENLPQGIMFKTH